MRVETEKGEKENRKGEVQQGLESPQGARDRGRR